MDEKDRYIKDMQDKINSLQAKIEDLKSKNQNDQASSLEKKKSDFQSKLDDLKDAGHDKWVDMKVGMENAWNTLKGEAEKAKS